MKRSRSRVGLAFAAGSLLISGAAEADVLLVDFYGYDYWEPATCYNALGFVTEGNPALLNLNHADNEYTYSLQNACLTQVDTAGVWIIYTFGGGSLDFYCDPNLGGTGASFGTNPPNATAPATFEDGECILGGDLSQLQVFFNMSTGIGSLDGQLTFTRGTQLANLPLAQRDGWSLAALREGTPGAPEGYFTQMDGQVFVPEVVPVAVVSWGALKHAAGRGMRP